MSLKIGDRRPRIAYQRTADALLICPVLAVVLIQLQLDAPAHGLPQVGIYEVAMDNGQFNTTSTDKRNRLIIDHKAMQEIMMHD